MFERMGTRLWIRLGQLNFEIGWFGGESLKLVSINLLEYNTEARFFDIINIQVAKFVIGLHWPW
jgi:hypothetical protein